MSALKVLHVSPFYETDRSMGGLGIAVGALASAQVTEGARVSVFTIAARKEVERYDCLNSVHIYSFPSVPPSRIFFSPRLLRALRARIRGFDIVHIHSLWHFPGTAAGFLSRRYSVPCVVSPHGTLNRWARSYHAYRKVAYWYLFDRRVALAATVIHFTTIAEEYEARGWIGDQPAVVVPLPVVFPDAVSLEDLQEWRASLGIQSEARLVGFLGRLHPKKGLELALDALALLKGVHLIVAGPSDGRTKERLWTRAQALGITDRVHWLGLLNRRERDRMLRAIDVFVYPSYSENFGLAVAEAMGARVPVVLTPGVNLAADIERHGGACVVPRDPVAMAGAIAELLDNRTAREVMGDAGWRFVTERFEARTVARQMLDVYEACLRGRYSRT